MNQTDEMAKMPPFQFLLSSATSTMSIFIFENKPKHLKETEMEAFWPSQQFFCHSCNLCLEQSNIVISFKIKLLNLNCICINNSYCPFCKLVLMNAMKKDRVVKVMSNEQQP